MMADVSCPTCGLSNPAEFDTCQFCGSKLQPQGASIRPGDEPIKRPTAEFEGASTSGDIAAIRPGEAPTNKNTSELEQALPAWLRHLRGSKDKDQVPADAPPASPPEENLPPAPAPSTPPPPPAGKIDWLAGLNASQEEEEEVPDWLSSIRGKTQEEEPAAPQAQTPAAPPEGDWLSKMGLTASETEPAPSVQEPAEPAAGLPDWFSSLRSELEPAAPAEAAPEPAPEPEPELAGLDKESEAAIPAEQASAEPDWMLRLKEETSAPATGSEVPTADVPDWLSGLPAEPSAPATAAASQAESSGEAPDWLNRLQPSNAASEAPQAASEETPDWLKNLEVPSAPAEQGALASEGNLDWLNDLQAPSTPAPAESAASETRPDEMPDWLKSLEPTPETPKKEPGAKAKPFKTGPLQGIGSEVPGWLSSLQADAATPAAPQPAPEPPAEELPPASFPDWLSGAKEAGAPALSQETTGQGELPSSFAVEQPDWLSSLRPEQAEAAPASAEAATEDGLPELLEKGDLPSWVQAMRPVAAVVADAQNTPLNANEPAEEHGPLAGLRGVLPIGVGIGLTRKPPAYSIKLQVGESQQKHSARLERSIASESEPGALHSPALISSAHILRWVVAAVLLLAVGLTIISGVDLGMAGAVYPPEMVAAMNLVGGLKPNSPVLVVFDYQPAFSGELEAAAAPVMDHLLFSGARLALLSTTPTGPALAERFLRNTQGQHNYLPDQQYVNLGYLAGGPAGVLDFTTEPSVAAPFTVNGKDAWALSPLQGVQKLSDFSLVIILTDDADVGRVWIEQAGPQLGATPMAMVISAQAEPMIRPYYDSGQIQGLVTGLAGGRAYEQAIQRPGISGKYWNAFGVAMLVAEIMIAVGAAWSIISMLRGRRPAQKGGA
jgi:hypothetical protein